MGRSVKPLWEQVELNYFNRLPAYRSWKRWLSVGFIALAVGWIVVSATRDNQSIYTSGPMSGGHELLGDSCEKCHTESWQGIKHLISSSGVDQTMNQACLKCHGTTIGHDNNTWSAWHQFHESDSLATEKFMACYHCHLEHEGPTRLTVIPDRFCVSCHADLQQEISTPSFAPAITTFHGDHPEFRILENHLPDQAKIQLNHAVHMKSNLRGPRGAVQMQCADCHRAGRSARDWPFGEATQHEDTGLVATSSEPDLQGAYMRPIRYSLHCKNCHELSIDLSAQHLNERSPVPHESPQMIRTYLRGLLLDYIQQHPEQLILADQTPSRRPTLRELTPKEIDRLSLEWVENGLQSVEQKLYKAKKVCIYCHDQNWPDHHQGLPAIASPEIPFRWLLQTSFNHEKHRVWDCIACHKQATTSTKTSDVMLPDIESCRQCHSPRATSDHNKTGGVADNCVLCHTYHQPNTGAHTHQGQSIKELISPNR